MVWSIGINEVKSWVLVLRGWALGDRAISLSVRGAKPSQTSGGDD